MLMILWSAHYARVMNPKGKIASINPRYPISFINQHRHSSSLPRMDRGGKSRPSEGLDETRHLNINFSRPATKGTVRLKYPWWLWLPELPSRHHLSRSRRGNTPGQLDEVS